MKPYILSNLNESKNLPLRFSPRLLYINSFVNLISNFDVASEKLALLSVSISFIILQLPV